MPQYRYRFVHKISNPRPHRWDGTIALSGVSEPTVLARVMRNARLLGSGERVQSTHAVSFVYGGPIVQIVAILPNRHPYHSVIFELVPRAGTTDRLHRAGARLLAARATYRWAAVSPEAARLLNDPVNGARIKRQREVYARIDAKIERVLARVRELESAGDDGFKRALEESVARGLWK